MIPVKDVNGLTILAKDEHMRPTTTMQSLASLQPSFVQMGELGGFDAVAIQAHPEVEAVKHVHHAGNSSGIVDGAAAVLIGNKKSGRRAGLKARARIKAFANIGSEPAMMLTGPVDVTKKVLKRAGMSIDDIDLIEINEAFASVVLRYLQAFDLDPAKVNVNGGAIAMGHPLGATGAMILGTLIDELERRDLKTALVTLVHRRRHGHRDDHRAGVSFGRSYGPVTLRWPRSGPRRVTASISGLPEIDSIECQVGYSRLGDGRASLRGALYAHLRMTE